MAAAKKTPAAKSKAAPKKSAAKTAKKTSTAPKVDVEARLAALPQECEQNPDQPVAVMTVMGRRCGELAAGEPALKTLAGFEMRYAEELPLYCDALDAREVAWTKARAGTRAGITPAKLKTAEQLKGEVMSTARYQLRKLPEEQQVLDQIAEGTGVADLSQDLKELAALVERHAPLFVGDPSFPKDAAAQARQLAADLDKGITPTDAAQAQAARNRAFWLVHEAVDEVRAALKHLWRNEPTKVALLGVTYVTQRVRASRKKAKDAASTPSAGPASTPA